jgi:DNA-binding LytR/AlgR family response regulator
MNYPYIIIDDDQESVLKTKAIADGFSELVFVASANNYSDGLNLILEHSPKLIFLEIDPADTTSNLSLALINELYRYLKVIPKIIITTTKKDLAFEAIQYEVADYMIKPVQRIDLIKSILKIKKSIGEEEGFIAQNQVAKTPQELIIEQPQSPDNFQESIEEEILVINENEEELVAEQPQSISQDTLEEILVPDETSAFLEEQIPDTFVQQIVPIVEQPLILCIKSYGDYRYIDANDICYFQADNNSTDIHLNNGEMVTAFKTLKHFEGILSSPFTRIHNSYIVNRNYISRIHTGNAVCYIKNTTTKIPFSKSYKENIDGIISDFANGNYLEI